MLPSTPAAPCRRLSSPVCSGPSGPPPDVLYVLRSRARQELLGSCGANGGARRRYIDASVKDMLELYAPIFTHSI